MHSLTSTAACVVVYYMLWKFTAGDRFAPSELVDNRESLTVDVLC